MNRFARYVLWQHRIPFLQGFTFVTLAAVLVFLFDFVEMIVSKGISPWIVGELFVYSQGYTLAITAPCSVLVAVLLTFGRLSQDQEVSALRTSGVPLISIFLPVVGAGVLFAAGLTLFNNHVLPETNHRFANLIYDIQGKRPSILVREGEFNSDFPSYRLLVGHVNYETSEWRDVTIYQLHEDRLPTTITARRGKVSYDLAEDAATIALDNGQVHEVPLDSRRRDRYQVADFRRHSIRISGLGQALRHSDRTSRGDRERSTRNMLDEIRTESRERMAVVSRMAPLLARYGYRSMEDVPQLRDLLRPGRNPLAWILGWFGPRPGAKGRTVDPGELGALTTEALQIHAYDQQIASYWVEIHKKFAIPAACVVYVLIGIPAGMRFRRAGTAVGVYSLVFFILHYLSLVAGEDLAKHMIISPFLGMWTANLFFGLGGLYFMLREAEVLPR